MSKRKNVIETVETETVETQAVESDQVNVEAAAEAIPETADATAPKPKAKKPTCLVKGCGRESQIRGLCGRCCTAARKLIKEGKATWEQLESLGIAAPPKHKVGGKGVFSGAFAEALDAATKKRS
jgi:hypothetical protein